MRGIDCAPSTRCFAALVEGFLFGVSMTEEEALDILSDWGMWPIVRDSLLTLRVFCEVNDTPNEPDTMLTFTRKEWTALKTWAEAHLDEVEA